MLLSGNPPFTGSSNEKIMSKIESGVVTYSGPKWNRISIEAIELIKKMLTYNYKERISAKEALRSKWLDELSNEGKVPSIEIMECVKDIKNFQVNLVMKKAVLSFIASHITKKGEENKLREIFKILDKDHSGTLSVEELTEGYKLIFNGNEELAKAEAERTINAIDDDKNGEIDYNGIIFILIDRILNGKFKEE